MASHFNWFFHGALMQILPATMATGFIVSGTLLYLAPHWSIMITLLFVMCNHPLPKYCNPPRILMFIASYILWPAYGASVCYPEGLSETHYRNLVDSNGVLICSHPHGAVGSGSFLFYFAVNKYTSWLRSDRLRFAAVDIIFKLPLVRIFARIYGGISAHRDAIHKTLRSRCSVMMFPGGVVELNTCTRGADSVYIRKRTGMIKLAMRDGTTIVPMYVLGETDLYTTLPWIHKYTNRLLRRLRTSLPIVPFGPYGLPLAHKVELRYAIGTPVHCDRTDKPTNEQVQEKLDEYILSLITAYDHAKRGTGYEHRQLIIY